MNMMQMLSAAVLATSFLVVGCDRGSSTGTGGSSATTAPSAVTSSGQRIKIGFIVKQPEEPWFQTEWKFAQKAADDQGFELVKIAGTDGEKVLAAIDNLAAQGAQGFVICTPDPKLGPAIKAKADAAGMKFMTVDDQFVGPDGQIMADVHHLGMSPHDIGYQAGQVEMEELHKRGWNLGDTACCVSSYRELDTARQRTDGAQQALVDGGFPKDKLYDAPNRTTDTPGSFDAANILLTQHPEAKHWLIVGMNDNAVLGAVRATEGRNFAPKDVIGVGINGTDCMPEFQKPAATGFVGSLLLSPNKHGYDTASMVYHWVKDGTEPPKLTLIKKATLITRDNYQQVLKEQGLSQ